MEAISDSDGRAAPTTSGVGGARWHSIRRRWGVNITPVERVGRVTLGLAAMVAGVMLLAGSASVLSVVLVLALLLAGLDLVLTGALGHCPLYRRLGYLPASLRRPT